MKDLLFKVVSLNSPARKRKIEGKILGKMHERIIKNFMGIIILAELRNGPTSGYDVISFIHNKFHFLVSSDTVHSFLYSLERNGPIEGTWDEKSFYRLTDKSSKTREIILCNNHKIKNLKLPFSKFNRPPKFLK